MEKSSIMQFGPEMNINVYISREVPDTQSKMVLLTSAKEEKDLCHRFCGDMYTQIHIGVYLSCLLAIERIENEHPV